MNAGLPLALLLGAASLTVGGGCAPAPEAAAEVRVVPLEQAVPADWTPDGIEDFARRREATSAFLESLPADEAAAYRDLMALPEGSLERALAEERERRIAAFVSEQEALGWELLAREAGALRFRRRDR